MEDEFNDEERTRTPRTKDLVDICRELNRKGANYIVVGGMAIIMHGYLRTTEDIDFLVETTHENEQKILEVLSELPEGAAKELKPGEVGDYVVVRICDEFTVDLMAKACGIDFETAKDSITWIEVDDVSIPFASPELLWKTKQTFREKDALDRAYLREILEDRGEWPVT